MAFDLLLLEGGPVGDISVIPLVAEGLGNSACLLDLDDGRALAVDASRDLRALREASERRELRVGYAADTHLYADFLTGAVHLARTDGAQPLASTARNREYPHTGLIDGARVLDLRQANDYDAGHVPGERAMGAASLLARAGHHNVTVFDGGPQDGAHKSGNALKVGQ